MGSRTNPTGCWKVTCCVSELEVKRKRMLLLIQLAVPNPGAAHEKIQPLASATSGPDTDDEA